MNSLIEHGDSVHFSSTRNHALWSFAKLLLLSVAVGAICYGRRPITLLKFFLKHLVELKWRWERLLLLFHSPGPMPLQPPSEFPVIAKPSLKLLTPWMLKLEHDEQLASSFPGLGGSYWLLLLTTLFPTLSFLS